MTFESPRWVSVSERLPESGRTVLACYLNRAGKWRRIRAMWIAAKTHESSCDSEIGEYDEETDTLYDPKGWYEKIDNWDEFGAIVVNEGEVSHWQNLPDHPEVDAIRVEEQR